MEKYPYQRIESPDAIRILELLPPTTEEIHVRLLHSALSDLPTCEALSYEWGESTREHDIICEGKILKGTSNLLAALKRLRLPDSPRLLWVDALCINQEDAVEVMQQVNLMTHLYKYARRVLIWLGEEELLTEKAFEMLPQLAESLDTVETFHFPFYGGLMRHARLGHGVMRSGDTLQQYISQEAWPAVWDIVSKQSYFTRLWTVQEVALSSEDSTAVVCGGQSIGWVTFYKAVDFISKETQQPIMSMLARHKRLQAKVHHQRCSLYDCVLATLRHAVTKQHDRVFALLGMVDERIRSKFAHLSDSSLITELFQTAAEAIISETQNLWYIGMLDSLSPREPSWSLWLEAGGGHVVNMFPPVLINNDHIEERPITIDGRFLNVYSFFLDTVEVVSKNLSQENLKPQVMEAYKRITHSCPEATKYGNPGDGIEDAFDALWQALTAYEEGVKRRCFQDMQLSFRRSIYLWILEDYGISPEDIRRNPKLGELDKGHPLRSLRQFEYTSDNHSIKDVIFLRRLEDHGISPEDIRRNPKLRELDPGHPLRNSKHTNGLNDNLSIQEFVLQSEILQSVYRENLFGEGEWAEWCLSDMRALLVEGQQGRNLFRGAAGFLGIGPLGGNGTDETESAVRVGDKIAILSKASLPVILRPCEDGCYSVVGSSYVSGLLRTSIYILHSGTRAEPPLTLIRLR